MSDDQEHPLRSGAKVPGYDIERELGRGGFAVVYRANQPKLRRTVALKVLTNVDPDDDDAKRRFEAECQAIGSLSWHPHVVTVYDAGATSEGLPFLAMEHLPSGSLQAKLGDHGKAPWTEVIRVAVQLCDALGAAHQAGILHRDIKPANVLTSRIGDYKLADFGIARFGDSTRTATGIITGTVAYTAPEVLRGTRASVASDLYALGSMLCAVASGKTPFVNDADESLVTIMYRVNTEEPPRLETEGVPEEVALLVRTLMDKEPDKRPATALEVAQWCQQIQADHGLPIATLHTDPDLEPRRPAAALAAGAAALGTAAAAAAATSTPPPSTPPPSTPPPATPPPTGRAPTPPPRPLASAPSPSARETSWTPAPSTPAPQPTVQPSLGGGQPPRPAPAPTYGGGPSTARPAYGNGGGFGGGTQSGSYATQGDGPPSSSNTWLIVVAVAVAALVVVAVIIGVAAAFSADSNASRPTTTQGQNGAGAAAGAATTTTAAPGDPATTTTTTTTTAEATTTTAVPTGEQYPSAARMSFLDSCKGSGGTDDYCTCVLTELESTLSFDEFQKFDREADPNAGIDELPPEVSAAITTCLPEGN